MSFSPFQLNNRTFSRLLDLDSEFNFEANKNYLFDLSYLSTLKVVGEKARDFLQGQLSCDVRRVNSDTIQQAALCNLQGRVLALMDVLEWHSFQLVLPKDLIEATQKSLSKTADLCRVKLQPTNIQIFGFYLANENDLIPESISLPDRDFGLNSNPEVCAYRLSKQFYLILTTLDFRSIFSSQNQIRGSLAWHYLQLKQKSLEIYPETRGLFLPHRLDLHLTGYLSFDKGCYKGQEVIARMHYRAKLKHSLQLFTVETEERLNPGAKLFTANGKTEVGELIDTCPITTNRYLIAASILHDAELEVLIEGQSNLVVLSAVDF
ncbi:MAG: folate-binding protein YgfZ [Tatlockia sp.]|nr:folate-binding protein YgfZ [Tatlockia sp.]